MHFVYLYENCYKYILTVKKKEVSRIALFLLYYDVLIVQFEITTITSCLLLSARSTPGLYNRGNFSAEGPLAELTVAHLGKIIK